MACRGGACLDPSVRGASWWRGVPRSVAAVEHGLFIGRVEWVDAKMFTRIQRQGSAWSPGSNARVCLIIRVAFGFRAHLMA
jgi:hypothetical protein